MRNVESSIIGGEKNNFKTNFFYPKGESVHVFVLLYVQ